MRSIVTEVFPLGSSGTILLFSMDLGRVQGGTVEIRRQDGGVRVQRSVEAGKVLFNRIDDSDQADGCTRAVACCRRRGSAPEGKPVSLGTGHVPRTC